ncbi:MAG: hypothetical protein J5994_08265 [Ruminococcus sp.]|nr:hypothetical protein [Ruminococcus sp.]
MESSVDVNIIKRMGLGGKTSKKKTRKHDRRYPELSVPGEKVQIDVKEVPYSCLRGAYTGKYSKVFQASSKRVPLQDPDNTN